MHLNDEKEHILFVFEGEKTEYAFYEALQNHNLSLKTKDREILSTFKADIYQLYKKIIEDDAEIFPILKMRDKTLENLSEDNVSSIFLFFDFDCHATNASDDKIQELLEFFNNETENGKIFISYPMVEAFKYFKCCNDIESFLDFKIDRVDVNRFKQISHEHSDHSKVLKRMQKQDFQHLIYLHCLKAHYLVNNIKDVVEEYVDQDQIFKVFDQSSNIPVLSSFPQLLKYFYKFEDFLELVEIKKS